MTRASDHVEVLAERTDSAFTAIQRRRGEQMQCRAGCSACCRARLAVTEVEAEMIRRGLSRETAERRTELAARTGEPNREMCVALDDDGRCGIYAYRPLICRSYGVPLRHRSDVPLVRPDVVDSCDLNFEGVRLETLPDEDIFDQSAMNDDLDAINERYCERNGLSLVTRLSLVELLGDDQRSPDPTE